MHTLWSRPTQWDFLKHALGLYCSLKLNIYEQLKNRIIHSHKWLPIYRSIYLVLDMCQQVSTFLFLSLFHTWKWVFLLYYTWAERICATSDLACTIRTLEANYARQVAMMELLCSISFAHLESHLILNTNIISTLLYTCHALLQV